MSKLKDMDLPTEVLEMFDAVAPIVTAALAAWTGSGERFETIGILITDRDELCRRTRTVAVGGRRVAAFITSTAGLRAVVNDLHPPAVVDVRQGAPATVVCAIAMQDGRLWITDIPVALVGRGGRT